MNNLVKLNKFINQLPRKNNIIHVKIIIWNNHLIIAMETI